VVSLGVSVCLPARLSVCLSVGHVREPCKTVKPIEMPFVWVTRVDPKNQIPMERAILGVVRPTKKHCKSLLRCTQQKISNDISETAPADCIAPD